MKTMMKTLVHGVGVGLGIGLALLLAGGYARLRSASAQAIAPPTTPTPAAASDVLRARRFELVNDKGDVIGVLNQQKGLPYLLLADTAGKPRISLAIADQNVPSIAICDTKGAVRAALTYNEQPKTARLLFFNDQSVLTDTLPLTAAATTTAATTATTQPAAATTQNPVNPAAANFFTQNNAYKQFLADDGQSYYETIKRYATSAAGAKIYTTDVLNGIADCIANIDPTLIEGKMATNAAYARGVAYIQDRFSNYLNRQGR